MDAAAEAIVEPEDDNVGLGPNVPKDKWKYVLFLFTLLGISGLLPWNLFITANEYFLYKFSGSNVNETHRNYFQDNFENYFVITGSISSVFGNIINVYLTSSYSGHCRVILGHIMVIFCLLPTFIFAFVETSHWILSFFLLTLSFIIVGQVASSGFMCGGAAGLAAVYPPQYMKAFITGQAICGVFISVVNIISLAVGSSSYLTAGRVYFGTAILFTLLSLVLYYPSKKNIFVKFYTKKRKSSIINETEEDNRPLLGNANEEVTIRINEKFSCAVLRKTAYLGSLIIIVFIVTLSCFPALTSKVQSTSDNTTWQKYFIPVCCFLFANFFDFIGRLLVYFVCWPSSDSWLLYFICVIRIGFVFLFLLCNFASKTYFPLVFYGDWWFGIFTSALGFTNGYLCNLLCVYLPRSLPDKEKELAGTLLASYISIGVLVGSCLSFGIVKFV